MTAAPSLPEPWIVRLHTADEILRELRHGWLHACPSIEAGHLWVTHARRDHLGLWLTVGAVPSEGAREVLWGPSFAVWTIL